MQISLWSYQVSPQELFDSHTAKAQDVASRLCFFYAVSGALNYREEASSEALMALWECCCRFDPSKQKMQQKIESKRTEEIIFSSIFGYDMPFAPAPTNCDPYKNFWIASLMRVRGSVLDYFRRERLIIKPVISGELATLTRADIKRIKNRIGVDDDDDIAMEFGISAQALEKLKPTMLHQERFLSLDRALGEACGDGGESGGRESFYEIIASQSKTDESDEVDHLRFMVNSLRARAKLTMQENKAIDYFYSDAGYTKSEVAGLMKVSTPMAKRLIDEALDKLRSCAFAISA